MDMNGFIFNFLFWYLGFVCFHSSVFVIVDYVNCSSLYLSANKSEDITILTETLQAR